MLMQPVVGIIVSSSQTILTTTIGVQGGGREIREDGLRRAKGAIIETDTILLLLEIQCIKVLFPLCRVQTASLAVRTFQKIQELKEMIVEAVH